VQDAIVNITERLRNLEAATVASAATLTASVAALQSSGGGSSSTPTTSATTYLANNPIIAYQALYLISTGTVAVCDPTIPAQAFGCIGVATGGASPGSAVPVATTGVITINNAKFIAQRPVFVGPAGALTQTPPTGAVIIPVGVALTATSIFVIPGQPILNAAQYVGAFDDFLPVTREPGTVWQLNGIQIAVRRKVEFISGSGLTITMTDDPSNDRVVINIGQNIIVIPSTQNIEDSWDWSIEELEDFDWFTGYDDATIGNNSVVLAMLQDQDAWDWSYEEPEEDTWVFDSSNAIVLNIASVVSEDPWDWGYDEPEEDLSWIQNDDLYLVNNNASPPVHLQDEYWDWGYEELDDDWVWAIDDYAQQWVRSVANGPEDPWDWGTEEYEQDFVLWLIEENQLRANALKPGVTVEDPWDWGFEELEYEPAWWSIDDYAQTWFALPGIIVEDPWDWGYEELDDEWVWGIDDYAQTWFPLPANGPEDAHDWSYEELEDDTTWWSIDDLAQNNPSVPLVSVTQEDPWDWSFEELEYEPSYWSIDDFAQNNPNAPFFITGTTTGSAITTISVPAGAVAGDMLILAVTNGTTSTKTLPAGFTAIDTGNVYGAYGYRVMQIGDTSFALGTTMYATLVAVRKNAGGPTYDATGSTKATYTVGTTFTTPSGTPAAAPAAAFMIFMSASAAMTSAPAYTNLIPYNVSGTGACGMAISWALLTTTSAFAGTSANGNSAVTFPAVAAMVMIE
jgi:hypothetical protein